MRIYIHMCRKFVRRYGYITGLEHAVVLLALYAYKIHAYTYMHMHTSVDLPMPPGPQSTHLFVMGSPLSNQSRMPFSSLDRRWNPFGALTLNTCIATTWSPSPRAAGAWRALMRGLRLSGTPAARVLNSLLEARAASHTVSHAYTACSWLERSHRRTCSRPFLCRCIGDCSRLQRGGLSCDWLCAHKLIITGFSLA